MVGAAAVGLAGWLLTMAAAPRYSYGPDQDLGDPIFWWILLGGAATIGSVSRRRPGRAAAVLVLPALILSPWTAPRGDNDGLWMLIVPMLAMYGLVLAVVARATTRLGRRLYRLD